MFVYFVGELNFRYRLNYWYICMNFSVNWIVDIENMYIMYILILLVIKIYRRKIERRVMLIYRIWI